MSRFDKSLLTVHCTRLMTTGVISETDINTGGGFVRTEIHLFVSQINNI